MIPGWKKIWALQVNNKSNLIVHERFNKMKLSIMKSLVLVSLIFFVSACTSNRYEFIEPNLNEIETRYRHGIKKYNTKIPEKLSLKKAKEIAIHSNPDPIVAASRVKEAMTRLELIQRDYYPTVDFSFTYSQDRNSLSQVLPRSEHFERFQPNVRVNYLILDGHRRHYSKLAAIQDILSSKQNFYDSHRLIVFAVSQSFYNTILQKEFMKIAREDMAFNKKLLDMTKKRIDQGVSSDAEFLNFQLRYNEAEINYLRAEEQYKNNRIVLAELMGIEENKLNDSIELIFNEKEFNKNVKYDYKELVELAKDRPDLKAIWYSIKAAHQRIKAGDASFKPRLSLDVQLGYSRLDDLELEKDNEDMSISATYTIPLINFGRRKAAIAELEAAMKSLEARYINEFNVLKSTIRQTLTRFSSTQNRMEIQKKTVDVSKRMRDIEAKKYDAGEVTLTRLNEVQIALVRSEINLRLEQVRILLLDEEIESQTGQNLEDLDIEKKKS